MKIDSESPEFVQEAQSLRLKRQKKNMMARLTSFGSISAKIEIDGKILLPG